MMKNQGHRDCSRAQIHERGFVISKRQKRPIERAETTAAAQPSQALYNGDGFLFAASAGQRIRSQRSGLSKYGGAERDSRVAIVAVSR